MSRTLTLSAALLLLSACEAVDSSSVLTDGMYADLTAAADGSGQTLVKAVLRVGGATSNTYVNLEGDDRLTATAGETTLDLEVNALGDYRDYTATFDVEAEDSLFTVAFLRTVDEGAPASTMTLPAPFALAGPAAEDVISRQADITLTWEPAGTNDAMSWRVNGECFFDAYGQVQGDPGTVVIPAGSLESVNEDAPTACEATVTVWRSRAGALDPGFGEGGAVFGQQLRQLTFRSDP